MFGNLATLDNSTIYEFLSYDDDWEDDFDDFDDDWEDDDL